MAYRLPPLNPLRAFEATARHLSVTRAAEELHVTHSAVSHQIRTLEEALNVRLFKRGAGRMVLSAEGVALLPAVSGAFERIALAASGLSQPEAGGRIAIHCVAGLLSLWLLPAISSFCKLYPQASLRMIPGNDVLCLRNPEIDVSICYGDGHWPEYQVELLSPVRLFPVCHPSLLRGRSLRTPKDVFNHTLLHADNGREWENWLLANGLEMTTGCRQHFLADARLALEAASFGNGVALGDTVTSRRSLASGLMIAPFASEVSAAYSFYVVRRRDSGGSAIVEAFVAWLFSQIRDSARFSGA
ncbi:MAG: LysR family transcriptional regulator [Rhodovulum sulfidophilum]|uniref:LysR family transcriptional regulator n=1 Tax=Rhodovulum sulfidophilum TaxID=35806 RepID=A0A2W5NIR0_RHOSU|nr:MAG: LysR family transcriptional regulator [Rhodovulum sulfidophilum]